MVLDPIVVEIETSDALVIEVPAQGPPGPPGATGPGGATTFALTAGMDLGGHRIVAVDDMGGAVYADSSDVAQASRVAGLTTGAAVTGASIDVQGAGEIEEPSWAWTPGQALYLGSAGQLSTTPATTGFSLIVGFAASATKAIINLGMPIILT